MEDVLCLLDGVMMSCCVFRNSLYSLLDSSIMDDESTSLRILHVSSQHTMLVVLSTY
jgi:hypothetical protein